MIHTLSTIATPVGTPQPSVNFNGAWVNELGSRMDLLVARDGKITGIYKTAVGSPGNLEGFDLLGFASGDLISFTVNFGKYGSLTSWCGQHTEDVAGSTIIKTMWILAQNVPDPQEPNNLWGAVLTGSNNFTR
ncbi:MAG: hypothetical protein H0U45_11635 [Tatlockia sp.]|jgi:hypothetical protein|nr:hypothetical protein [Tatlockia sp.]